MRGLIFGLLMIATQAAPAPTAKKAAPTARPPTARPPTAKTEKEAPTPASPAITDKSFIFKNPTLDLLALQTLTPKSPTPAPSSSNLLPLLVLSGALGDDNGFGGGGFGNNYYDGNTYYDQYGNAQNPLKKAVLLSQIASGSVSPLTAVAMDRNPGMSTTDTLVAGALGNNALTSLLVLNQPKGVGLTDGLSNGGLFGNGYGNGGILGGGNGVLPALVLASAVGGNSNNGLTTLLTLDALSNNNNNYNNNYNGFYNGNGYYAPPNSYYSAPYSAPPAYSTTSYVAPAYSAPATYTAPYTTTYYDDSYYNNGGAFGNVGANINRLFG